MPQKKETRMNEAKERMPKWATWSVEDEVKCNHLENELNEMIQGLHIQVGFENHDGVKYVTYHASWDATKIDLEKWFPNMSKEDLEGYGMEMDSCTPIHALRTWVAKHSPKYLVKS